MRLAPFLCLGGIEVANVNRVTSYGECQFFDTACPCPALDTETYVSPETDPAPWYDANYPESADFLGFLPQSITLSPPGSRSVTPNGSEGSWLGEQTYAGRVVDVVGWMVSRDLESQWWGQRWLTEVLSGIRCSDCCDTLELLPYCRQDPGSFDLTQDFRTLVGAGTVDGPRFVEVSDDPDFVVTTAQFQMVSTKPWLYLPVDNCLVNEPIVEYAGDPISCLFTTAEWMDGTITIDISAQSDVTDLVITGRVSLDGDCPVGVPGDSVMPCFTYTVAEMKADDRLVIDGRRRKANYFDASEKFATSLLPRLDFTGPMLWPDVDNCTSLCLTIEVGSGDATATVDTYLREL